jgi:hypothetical protein
MDISLDYVVVERWDAARALLILRRILHVLIRSEG